MLEEPGSGRKVNGMAQSVEVEEVEIKNVLAQTPTVNQREHEANGSSKE